MPFLGGGGGGSALTKCSNWQLVKKVILVKIINKKKPCVFHALGV